MVIKTRISVREIKVGEMVRFPDRLATMHLRLLRDDLNCGSVARHVFLDSNFHGCVVTVFNIVLNLVLLFLLLDVRSPGLLVANHKLCLDI